MRRVRYFTHHGVDRIYDVDTAKAEGYIPEDYWVLRGMEDEYLDAELSKSSTDYDRRFLWGLGGE